jgi:hypothetical protein
VYALNTAFNAYGNRGVGSREVAALRAPRIAMLAGEGIDATSFGAAWYTLAERLDYPFTPLRAAQVLEADLRDFDVIVVPDLRGGDLRRGLGDTGIDRLRRWTAAGGTLVAWGGAAVLAAQTDLASIDFVGADDDFVAENDADAAAARQERIAAIEAPASSQEPGPPAISPAADPDVPEPVPGAVFEAHLDLGHWLSFGYADVSFPVLIEGADFMRLSPSAANVAVFPDEPGLLLSGFAWPGNTERLLVGTAYAIVEPRDNGQIVLLGQDPNFRLAWRSTGRLFGNALLLGGTLR